MGTKIIICKKCNSKRIKTIKQYNKNVYVCLDCNGHSYDTTKKERYLMDDDYTIYDNNTPIKKRLELYNFLFKDIKSKNKFLNTKDINNSLKRWLNINYIIISDLDITIENIFNYSKNIQEEDMICKNPKCNNKTEFFAIHNRYPNGRKLFCSKKCDYEYKSFRQMGEKNTCHKISDETKKTMSKNQSILLKEKIKNGEFTPNITNSWSNSMTKLKIKNEIKNYRSTWEAFFNLVNPNLLYEKIRIEYFYKNKKHNYIVDFIDEQNKQLYEVKPTSERYKLKNTLKTKYAIEWCENNGYEYNIIDNNWFKINYTKYKYLIKNQPDEKKLFKNLKQFDNEN